MIHHYSGSTANEAWLKAVTTYRDDTIFQAHQGRGGDTKELLHVGFSIRNPRQRWVTSRRPIINPAFALAEIIWIIQGRNDVPFLAYWNSRYPDYVKSATVAYGAYGYRLKSMYSIDQLDRVHGILVNNPGTRQAVLQIWDAGRDLPRSDGKVRAGDIPCSVISLLKVRRGKLDWMQIIRSNDLFRGVPYNMVQFTYLQEILAGWVGVKLGSFNQISDSLHAYIDDEEQLNAFDADCQEVRNSDSISWSRDESSAVFEELEQRAEGFIAEKWNKNSHIQQSLWSSGPEGAQNILCVLSAEAARRRGWIELSGEVMQNCTNPCFVQLWDLWAKRVIT